MPHHWNIAGNSVAYVKLELYQKQCDRRYPSHFTAIRAETKRKNPHRMHNQQQRQQQNLQHPQQPQRPQKMHPINRMMFNIVAKINRPSKLNRQ